MNITRIRSTQKLHGHTFLKCSSSSQNIWGSCIKNYWVKTHGAQDILQIVMSPDDLGVELSMGLKVNGTRVPLGRTKPSSFEHGAMIFLNPGLNTAPPHR